MKFAVRFRSWPVALLAVLFLPALTACPSKKGGSGSGNVGIGSLCQAGYLYVNQSPYVGCYPTAGCTQPNTANVGGGQCLPGSAGPINPINPGGNLNLQPRTYAIWEGQMRILNPGAYQPLLKDMFICDIPFYPDAFETCHTWDDYASFRLELYGTNLAFPNLGRATVIAQSSPNWYYGGGARGIEFPQSPWMEYVYPVNANSGFQMNVLGQAGTYAYNKNLRVTGNVGAVLSGGNVVQALTVRVNYAGTDIGEATVYYRYGY